MPDYDPLTDPYAGAPIGSVSSSGINVDPVSLVRQRLGDSTFQKVDEVFRQAGVSTYAWAHNAYSESGGSPARSGMGGAVGLFQLDPSGVLGDLTKKYGRAGALQIARDPVASAGVMAEIARSHGVSAINDPYEQAKAFVAKVERPAARYAAVRVGDISRAQLTDPTAGTPLPGAVATDAEMQAVLPGYGRKTPPTPKRPFDVLGLPPGAGPSAPAPSPGIEVMTAAAPRPGNLPRGVTEPTSPALPLVQQFAARVSDLQGRADKLNAVIRDPNASDDQKFAAYTQLQGQPSRWPPSPDDMRRPAAPGSVNARFLEAKYQLDSASKLRPGKAYYDPETEQVTQQIPKPVTPTQLQEFGRTFGNQLTYFIPPNVGEWLRSGDPNDSTGFETALTKDAAALATGGIIGKVGEAAAEGWALTQKGLGWLRGLPLSPAVKASVVARLNPAKAVGASLGTAGFQGAANVLQGRPPSEGVLQAALIGPAFHAVFPGEIPGLAREAPEGVPVQQLGPEGPLAPSPGIVPEAPPTVPPVGVPPPVAPPRPEAPGANVPLSAVKEQAGRKAVTEAPPLPIAPAPEVVSQPTIPPMRAEMGERVPIPEEPARTPAAPPERPAGATVQPEAETPPAPSAGPEATGLANQVQLRQVQSEFLTRVPEKGRVVSPDEALARGKAGVADGSVDVDALRQKVGEGGYTPTATEFGALLAEDARLAGRVNATANALDAEIAAHARGEVDGKRVSQLQDEYDAAQGARMSFLDDVQKGKTEASNTFRALQAGATLDEANFAQVIERYQRQKGTQPVTSEERQQISDLTQKLNKAQADLETERQNRIEAEKQRTTAAAQATIRRTRAAGKVSDARTERQAIFDEIKQIWKESAPTKLPPAGPGSRSGAVINLAYAGSKFAEKNIAGRLAGTFMKEGMGHLEGITARVIAELNAHGVKATYEDVVDDIVALGKRTAKSRSVLQEQIAKLKGEARRDQQLRQQIENLKAGIPNTPPAKRGAVSDRITALEKERDALTASLEGKDLQSQQRVRAQIERLKSGQPAPKREVTPGSPELQQLRAERDALLKSRAADTAKARRVADLNSQIETLKQGGSLPKKVAPTRAVDAEVQKLTSERDALLKAQRDAARQQTKPQREAEAQAKAYAKRVETLNAQIEALKKGETVPKRLARAGPDPRIEALQKERDTLLKAQRKPEVDAKAEASRLDRLNEQIKTLEGGGTLTKGTRPEPSDAVKALTGQRNELERQRSARAQISDLEEQLRSGNYEVPNPKVREVSEKMQEHNSRIQLLKKQIRARIANARTRTPAEQFEAFFKTALLSNPQISVRKLIADATAMGIQVPMRAARGVLDVPISKLQGREREFFPSEAGAGVRGYAAGVKPGLREAKNIIRHGMSGTEAERVEMPHFELGGAKNPLNWIPRATSAVNEAAWHMNFQGELAAQANRIAKRTGQSESALFANPTKEMQAQAERIADLNTWKGTPDDEFMNRVMNLRNWTVKGTKFRPLHFLIPVLRTGYEMAKEGAKYTPGGLFDLLAPTGVKDRTTGKFSGPMLARTSAASTTVAKATVGTAIMAPLVMLASQGRLTGELPGDEKERRAFYAAGLQPNSIKVGDRWVAFDHTGLLQTPLSVVANLFARRDPANLPTDQRIARTISALGQAYLGQRSIFADMSALQEALSNPTAADRWLAALVPVPGAVRLAEQVTGPEEAAKPSGFVQRVQASIPGASAGVPRASYKRVTGVGALSPFRLSPPTESLNR